MATADIQRSGAGPSATFLSDQDLVRRIGAGDDSAFEALYERYRTALYRYCRAIVKNAEDAEEAFQITMLNAYRALTGEIDRPVGVRPWLYRIAHNECINILRVRPRSEELAEVEDVAAGSVHDQVALQEQMRQLRRDLETLPPLQRSALVLKEMSGFSHEAIAGVLDTSPADARRLVYQARQSLSEYAHGRGQACDEIRQVISDGDRRVTRSRRIKGHLVFCDTCSAFALEQEALRQGLAAFLPVLPTLVGTKILVEIVGSAANAPPLPFYGDFCPWGPHVGGESCLWDPSLAVPLPTGLEGAAAGGGLAAGDPSGGSGGGGSSASGGSTAAGGGASSVGVAAGAGVGLASTGLMVGGALAAGAVAACAVVISVTVGVPTPWSSGGEDATASAASPADTGIGDVDAGALGTTPATLATPAPTIVPTGDSATATGVNDDGTADPGTDDPAGDDQPGDDSPPADDQPGDGDQGTPDDPQAGAPASDQPVATPPTTGPVAENSPPGAAEPTAPPATEPTGPVDQDPGTVPGGDTTVPGGDTTVPGGDTTLPGGGTTLPGGGTTLPGGGTTLPGGGTTVPGGDTTLPGGGTTLPGGGTTVPGGDTTLPGGGTTLPPREQPAPVEGGIIRNPTPRAEGPIGELIQVILNLTRDAPATTTTAGLTETGGVTALLSSGLSFQPRWVAETEQVVDQLRTAQATLTNTLALFGDGDVTDPFRIRIEVGGTTPSSPLGGPDAPPDGGLAGISADAPIGLLDAQQTPIVVAPQTGPVPTQAPDSPPTGGNPLGGPDPVP